MSFICAIGDKLQLSRSPSVERDGSAKCPPSPRRARSSCRPAAVRRSAAEPVSLGNFRVSISAEIRSALLLVARMKIPSTMFHHTIIHFLQLFISHEFNSRDRQQAVAAAACARSCRFVRRRLPCCRRVCEAPPLAKTLHAFLLYTFLANDARNPQT